MVGIKPYCDFDIQQMVNMAVITYWGQNDSGTFQHIETIIPQTKKIVPKIEDLTHSVAQGEDPLREPDNEDSEEDVPF